MKAGQSALASWFDRWFLARPPARSLEAKRVRRCRQATARREHEAIRVRQAELELALRSLESYGLVVGAGDKKGDRRDGCD